MILFSKILGKEGYDLIILHGLFGMGDNWNTLGKMFSKHCKVHLIDLRNHGRSLHSSDFNYDVMSDDILEYMYHHNIINPIILGHSLGGKVAMKLAFTYPNKLKKLIIVDIAPKEYKSNFYRELLAVLYKIPLEDFDKREQIDELLSDTFYNKEMRFFLLKNLYRNEKKQFAWRFNIDILLEKVQNIEDASFVLGKLDVPTFFIRGGNSDYINLDDEDLINNHFANFSISTINGAGHWLHAEKPKLFYDEVISALLLEDFKK